MSDTERLLEVIEEGIVGHGGDLGGWTRLDDERLQLFDGRVTLRAEICNPEQQPAGMVHAHIFTTLHEHDDEELDACVFGMGDDNDEALRQAAVVWITCVAGPIRSFIDDKPVCMTCQAGVAGGEVTQGYAQGNYGLPNLRAYVGPSVSRGFAGQDPVQPHLDDTQPWFRFAAESAAPRRVHLAKATVLYSEKEGCRRELEIDGHDVSYSDRDWPTPVRPRGVGYLTRFAVFEFPRNSSEIPRRAELERTIRHFAENYEAYESVDLLMDDMVKKGFDADLVHETESFSTIAFSRTLFEQLGVQYSSTIIRARRDGRVEMDVPLMSMPAYSRARALAIKLRQTMPEQAFQALCLYNAESHAIVNAMEAAGDRGDLSQMTMYPCVVPERGVSKQTMDQALAALQDLIDRSHPVKKKPWWKFW